MRALEIQTNRKARCRIRIARCNVIVDAIVRNQIVAIVVECGAAGAAECLIIVVE